MSFSSGAYRVWHHSKLCCARCAEEKWWQRNYVNRLVCFEPKVVLIPVVSWPRRLLLRRPSARPNTSSAFSIHVFWLTAITLSITFSAKTLRVRRRGRCKCFLWLWLPDGGYFSRMKPRCFRYSKYCRTRAFWNCFCAHSFSSPWERQ